MADAYRCINAFSYGDRVYPGGLRVEEGDAILDTHAAHFARVHEPVVVEAATAEPGERRDLTPPKKVAAKKAAPPKKASPPSQKAAGQDAETPSGHETEGAGNDA